MRSRRVKRWICAIERDKTAIDSLPPLLTAVSFESGGQIGGDRGLLADLDIETERRDRATLTPVYYPVFPQ